MRYLPTVIVLLFLVILPVQAQSSLPTEIARYGQGGRNPFMSWSPDGSRLAVGGNHGYWLYDTQDPEHPAEFVYTASYTQPAYGLDGRLLLTHDRQVQVLDGAGTLLWEIEGDIATWSADGSLIAVGDGPTLSIWDAATQTLLHDHTMLDTAEGHGQVSGFYFIAGSPQVYFRYFASGPNAYWDISYVWEPENDTVTLLDDYFPSLSGRCEHFSPCFSPVAISTDGATLALLRIGGNAYFDEVIFLEPATGAERVIQLEVSPFGDAASFSPDGTLFAVAENPRGISVWDTTTWEQRYLLMDTGKPRFSPDSHSLATNERVITVDAQTSQFDWEITRAVRTIGSPDGRLIMELGTPPRILNTVTGAEIATLAGVDSPVVLGVISPDGQWAATAHENLTAYLWDVATEPVPREMVSITEEVRGELRMEPRSGPTFPATWLLTFSPDSTLLAVRNNGTEVVDRAFVWEVSQGTRYNLPEATRFDNVQTFTEDSRVRLRDDQSPTIIWEPRTNAQYTASIFELIPPASGTALSDDGRLLVTIEYTPVNRIVVYDVATETLLAETPVPEGNLGVSFSGFSANNTYFAYNVYYSDFDPGTDYIWDIDRNEFVAPEAVTDVWFVTRSPSFGVITERTPEQSALMLYPSDATPDTAPLARLGTANARALFFPDESHVLATYSDGVIVVWRLD